VVRPRGVGGGAGVRATEVCVVVLAKAPQRGFVKTRLAAAIGDDGALGIYRQLLARTAAALHDWPGAVLLASAGDPAAFAGTWWQHRERIAQPDGPLGARIAAALRAGLDRRPVAVVVGTDCPGITAAALAAVAERAEPTNVAFGPCPDGGFWAIAGRSRAVADVLAVANVPWSSERTLAVCIDCLAAAGFDSVMGPRLADCDTDEDVAAAVAAGLLAAPAPNSRSR